MKEVVRYRRCFVCGEENLHGLNAKFLWDGHQAYTEIVATDAFEGYRGIYHGGITAALLDEVMVKAILASGIYAFTAELTIRYKKPVRVGDKIRFVGRIVSRKGRLLETEGEAIGEDGNPVALAKGSYIEARTDLKENLSNSVD